jgi:hypothetical protein
LNTTCVESTSIAASCSRSPVPGGAGTSPYSPPPIQRIVVIGELLAAEPATSISPTFR